MEMGNAKFFHFREDPFLAWAWLEDFLFFFFFFLLFFFFFFNEDIHVVLIFYPNISDIVTALVN